MKRPRSLMQGGWIRDRPRTHGRRVTARVGLGAAGLWFLLASAPAWGQPPRPFVPEITETKRVADAVRRDTGIPSARPASRLLLQHAVRRQRAGQAPELVQDPGTVRLGHENARHAEHLSLLLRHARPEHDRLVEPPLVAAGPVLPGAGATLAAGRDVLQLWLIRADLRPRPDRAWAWALSFPVLLQLAARRLTLPRWMSGDRFSAASAMND